jgi:hypothetical protein
MRGTKILQGSRSPLLSFRSFIKENSFIKELRLKRNEIVAGYVCGFQDGGEVE